MTCSPSTPSSAEALSWTTVPAAPWRSRFLQKIHDLRDRGPLDQEGAPVPAGHPWPGASRRPPTLSNTRPAAHSSQAVTPSRLTSKSRECKDRWRAEYTVGYRVPYLESAATVRDASRDSRE